MSDVLPQSVVEAEDDPRCEVVVHAAAGAVVLIALLVMAGWALDIGVLKSLLPSLRAMKANSAFCVSLLAAAVWLARTRQARARNAAAIRILVSVVVVVALVIAAEYVFHWNAGIDQILFIDLQNLGWSGPPGRSTPATIVSLVLLSVSLLLLEAYPRLSQVLTGATGLLAFFTVIVYLEDVPARHGAGHAFLSLPAIFAFLFLCTALFAARPDRGLTALLRESLRHVSPAGTLLVIAIILPMFLSSIAVFWQRQGWYGYEFTLAFFCLAMVVVAVAIIWEAERQKLQGKRLVAESALRHNEYRLRLALESGAVGIWEHFPLTGERRWDARCREILGFPLSVVLETKHVLASIHPEDVAAVRECMKDYLDPAGTGRFELGFRIFTWDGELRYVYARGLTLFEGEGDARRAQRSIGTLQDISAIKQGENALRRAKLELEQFAYAAAHDLQEPLRNVGLTTQLLARFHAEHFSQDARSLLNSAIEGSLRIQAMVKDLLAYSRAVDTAEPAPPMTDPNAVLAGALETLRPLIHASRAQISFDQLPIVCMSESHLLRVFLNVINNSLQYAGPREPVIRISSTMRSGVIVFFVRDNGVGIPAECRDRVFGVFKRLHRLETPGTGMGLALCKRIVEHYGGKIWVEPNGSQGTIVLFSAPLAAAQESKKASA